MTTEKDKDSGAFTWADVWAEGFAHLLPWADALAGALHEELGVRLEVITDASASRATRAEVTWVRDARARRKAARMMPDKKPKRFSPLTYGHASITVRVFDSGVEATLEVPPHAVLDRAALRWRLQHPEVKMLVLGQIGSLPQGVTAPALGHRQASTLGADDLAEWARDLDVNLAFSSWIEKEAAIAEPTRVEDHVRALARVYREIAWDERMRLPQRAFRPRSAERQERTKRSERARTRRETRRARDEEPLSIREPRALIPEPSANDAEPAAGRSTSRLHVHAPVRLVDIDPGQPIAKGTRVFVLAGPFEGKSGVVKDIDREKGMAKVIFGLLGVDVRVADLAATRLGTKVAARSGARRGKRPLLSSSHKKRPAGTKR